MMNEIILGVTIGFLIRVLFPIRPWSQFDYFDKSLFILCVITILLQHLEWSLHG